MLAKKNFSKSKLLSGISIGASTLTMLSGEGALFPPSGVFMSVIWSAAYGSPAEDPTREIIRTELSSGDTFNITRAQEGTSAKAWSANDNIAHVITAGSEGIQQIVHTQTGNVFTGTGTIPFDDTIPQNTEGSELSALSTSITPRNINNILIIDVMLTISTNSASDYMIVALFKDSDVNAIACIGAFVSGEHPIPMTFRHRMSAGTVSPITFKIRAGTELASTTTLNGHYGVRQLGGKMASNMTITELCS